jgi:uncharacterized protein (DUF1778 family)
MARNLKMPAIERDPARREDRLEARISREAKALCRRAAKLQGRTLTDFVVHTVVEAAKRTIHADNFVELSRRDRTAFVKALLNPPVPNARLREAAARRAQVVVS